MPLIVTDIAAYDALKTGEKVVVAAPDVTVREGDVLHGLRWLDRFEVAAPLRPYSQLALHHGTKPERQATAAVIGDLRQPVYDDRLLFLRRCEGTDALMAAAWEEGCRFNGADGLPFLRALWRTKPLILALPTGWLKEGGE